MGRFSRGLVWAFVPTGFTSESAAADYNRRFWTDRFGDGFHWFFGLLWFFTLGLPVSMMEIAFLFLGGCLLIRLWFIRSCVRQIWLQWPTLWWFVFFVWQWLALAWSSDTHEGVLQAGALRFAGSIFVLYPMLKYRGSWMIAMVAGFALGHLSQLASAFDLLPSFISTQRSSEGRTGGWWPEVIGGELLAGIFALHVGALVTIVWRWQHRALDGVRACQLAAAVSASGLISLIGLVATGTRSAWISAILMLGFGGVVSLLGIHSKPARRLAMIVLAGVVVVVAAAGVWLATSASSPARARVVDARNEIARVIHDGEYHTNNGLRIKMVLWSIDALMEKPIVGVGTGAFRNFVLDRKPEATGNELKAIELFETSGHGHAHNMLMQTLATNGIIGGALLVLCIVWWGVLAVRNWLADARGWIIAPACETGTRAGLLAGLAAQFATAAPWGALGLLLIFPFDVVLHSAQTAALFFAFVAASPGWWPGVPCTVSTHAARRYTPCKSEKQR